MKFLRQTLAIAAKDLRSEIRGKEAVNASVSFALVILLLFSFAFDLEPEQIRDIAGGLLWLIFAFAGTLILNRSFARELVNDCLDALLASPVSGAQLFFGKCLANYVLIIIVECISLPVFAIFYNVRLPTSCAAIFSDAARHLGHHRDRNAVQRHDRESAPARADAAHADLSYADSGA